MSSNLGAATVEKTRSTSTLAVCVACGALAAAATTFARGIRNYNDFQAILWTAVLAAVLALPVARTLRGGTIRLDHPSSVMACVLLQFWLLGAISAEFHDDWMCSRAQDFIGQSALCGVIAGLAFYVGAGLPPTSDASGDLREPEMSTVGYVAWTGALAVLWASRVALVASGRFFTHAAVIAESNDVTSSYVVQICNVFTMVPAFLGICLLRKHRAIGLVILLSNFAYLLFSGSRALVIQLVLASAITVSLLNRKTKLWVLGVCIVGFVGVINPFVVGLRNVISSEGNGPGLGPAEVAAKSFYGETRDDGEGLRDGLRRASASGYLADIMCLAERSDFEFLGGQTFVDSTESLIPRVFWRDKPDLPVMADMIGAMNTHLSLPMNDGLGNPIMEGYINFSYFGVAGLFVLLGLGCRFFWYYRVAHWDSLAHLGLYPMGIMCFCLFETHNTVLTLASLRVTLPLMLVAFLARLAFGRAKVSQVRNISGVIA